MKHKAFFWFMSPSIAAMALFIALPIVSIVLQSLHSEPGKTVEVIESCGPFGCTQTTLVTDAAEDAGGFFGVFSGMENYTNRNHMALSEVSALWSESDSIGKFAAGILNLPLYKALAFTLTYTFCVTPLVLLFGLLVAMSVNRLPRLVKGPVIFTTILPMIVTPLIGSLILFWMIDSRGIIGASIQNIFDDPNLSLKGSVTLTWITLIVYGVWHHSPFAFVVYYAALQTVPSDQLESAMVDGANVWQRLRYVVLPHLAPVTIFIALISLMDNVRVFEPIIGFNAGASAQSLSWLVYNDLRNETGQLYGSAAATSVLTIAAVMVVLTPAVLRTIRDFRRRA